jgi:hypothetical protein
MYFMDLIHFEHLFISTAYATSSFPLILFVTLCLLYTKFLSNWIFFVYPSFLTYSMTFWMYTHFVLTSSLLLIALFPYTRLGNENVFSILAVIMVADINITVWVTVVTYDMHVHLHEILWEINRLIYDDIWSMAWYDVGELILLL